MHFHPNDVKILAETIMDSYWQLDESGKNCYVQCRYCYRARYYVGYDYKPESIVHALECPVLYAKDLLTGMEE